MNSGSVIDQDNSSIHVELHSTYVLENEFGVGGVLQYNAPIDKGDSADEGTFYTCLFRVEQRQTGNLFPLLFNHLPRLCCCVYRFATFLRTRESPVPIVGEETLMFCLFDTFRICKKSGFEYNEMGSSQSHEVFDLLGST